MKNPFSPVFTFHHSYHSTVHFFCMKHPRPSIYTFVTHRSLHTTAVWYVHTMCLQCFDPRPSIVCHGFYYSELSKKGLNWHLSFLCISEEECFILNELQESTHTLASLKTSYKQLQSMTKSDLEKRLDENIPYLEQVIRGDIPNERHEVSSQFIVHLFRIS